MPGGAWSNGGEQGEDGSIFDLSVLVVSESPSPAIHPGAPCWLHRCLVGAGLRAGGSQSGRKAHYLDLQLTSSLEVIAPIPQPVSQSAPSQPRPICRGGGQG